ncbi:MAG: N-acetyltransferase [Hyphomonadaceae bacterium]|nr:N-acetyltransferase [Hyphomonadaceae bacterium]
MGEISIRKEEQGAKGRYVASVEGQADVGEMTFTRLSDKLIIVDHTGVPDSLRGMGVGQALAAHVVAEARAQGFRIVPLCPFLRAQFERHHPEWADVMRVD